MKAEEFFELLLKELEFNPELKGYYRFLNNKGSFLFRKAHFLQRLKFIEQHINDKNTNIWDCGCGYGTTAIFLALNGFKVYGNTLEYYFKQIPKRLEYWSRVGDISGFTYGYENIFDKHPAPKSIDIIILQDTLHHLEPINDAFQLFGRCLTPNGKLVVSEVNGSNIFERTKFFLQRGNKRVIELYDERLKKKIPFGNENIRSMKEWNTLMVNNGFEVNTSTLQYIRFFMPFRFNEENYDALLEKEQLMWKQNNFLKNYFFFGVNFEAVKK